MELEYTINRRYRLLDASRIPTGCGALWRAQDLDLRRDIAVKQVNIPGNDPDERKQNYDKAYSEVQEMVLLGDEDVRIPKIYDAWHDEENSVLYIFMEWIRGDTLDKYFDYGEWQFLTWMVELCEILEQMALRGLYHKDIKPSNIMITRSHALCLIDFNISISASNLIEGTEGYRAPEMSGLIQSVRRDKVDMFAIGVLLYSYYTKELPLLSVDYAASVFERSNEWEFFIEPKEKDPNIRDTINSMIVKCMRLDPRQRYRSIGDLKYELEKAVDEIDE